MLASIVASSAHRTDEDKAQAKADADAGVDVAGADIEEEGGDDGDGPPGPLGMRPRKPLLLDVPTSTRDPGSKWNLLSSKVSSSQSSLAMDAALHHATLEKATKILSLPAGDRTADDIKFLLHYFKHRRNSWKFLLNKRPELFERLARDALVSVYDVGDKVCEVSTPATGMYVVMFGAVGVYVPAQAEEEQHSPSNRASFSDSAKLEEVQRSLDFIKSIASVPKASEVETVEKEDFTSSYIDSDSDEDSGFDAKRTWGRASGRFRQATLLSKAISLFESGKKMKKPGPAPAPELVKVSHCRPGDYFGEMGLLDRRPVSKITAVCKKPCVLLEIPCDLYAELSVHNLLKSDVRDDVAFLRSVHWLGETSEAVLTNLAYAMRTISVPPNQLVVVEGEMTNVMYIIKEGQIGVVVHQDPSTASVSARSDTLKSQRHMHQLGVIGPGQSFGEKPLLVGKPSDFAYITQSRCTLLAIGQKAFQPLRRRLFATMLDNLMKKTAHRSARLAELVNADRRMRRQELLDKPVPKVFDAADNSSLTVQPVHASRPLHLSKAVGGSQQHSSSPPAAPHQEEALDLDTQERTPDGHPGRYTLRHTHSAGRLVSSTPLQTSPLPVRLTTASSARSLGLTDESLVVGSPLRDTAIAGSSPLSPGAGDFGSSWALGADSPFLRSGNTGGLVHSPLVRGRRGPKALMPAASPSPLHLMHDPLGLGSFQSGKKGLSPRLEGTSTGLSSPQHSKSSEAGTPSGARASPAKQSPLVIRTSPTHGLGTRRGQGSNPFASVSPPPQVSPSVLRSASFNLGSDKGGSTTLSRSGYRTVLPMGSQVHPLPVVKGADPFGPGATQALEHSKMPHCPTGSLPGNPHKHVSASVSRLLSPGGSTTHVEGYIGAGRSPKRDPSQKPAARGGRKAYVPVEETTSPTIKYPAASKLANLCAPDGTPLYDSSGDLLPSKTLLAAKKLVKSVAQEEPAEVRDFTKALGEGPELQRRMEKTASQPLRRTALVAMGVQ